MKTRSPDRQYTAGERIAAGFTAVAAFVGVSACSWFNGPDVLPSYGPTAPKAPEKPSAHVVPDFTNYHKDGTCDGDRPRPCFLPLRKTPGNEPVNEHTVVNLLDGTGTFRWPLEPYNGAPGDAVEVRCQVTSKSVVKYLAGSSDVWDVVRVPTLNMSSAAIYEAQRATTTQSYGIEKDENGNVAAVYAYAPAGLLPSPEINALPPCENDPNNLAGSPNPQKFPPA